jgi:hypothetical protein
MTKSLIGRIDSPAELKKFAPIPEDQVKRATPPPSRPVVPRPVKRRGPIIAGGIIRFDLGRTRE